MDFLKIFRMLIILIFFSSYSIAQIESGKVDEKKKEEIKGVKKVKTVKEAKPVVEQPNTVFYFGGGVGSSYRLLKENTNIFAKPLGERVNEEATIVPNFSVGMRTKLAGDFYFDLGVSFAKNAERYEFKGTDSAFSYQTNFNHFAVPLKLQYIKGNKLKVIAGIGIQPQMLLNYRKHLEWTDHENVVTKETVKSDKNSNFFSIAALANLGLEYRFHKNISIYLLPEVRFQLNSSFQKQAPYIHKGTFFGGQLGFSFAIN